MVCTPNSRQSTGLRNAGSGSRRPGSQASSATCQHCDLGHTIERTNFALGKLSCDYKYTHLALFQFFFFLVRVGNENNYLGLKLILGIWINCFNFLFHSDNGDFAVKVTLKHKASLLLISLAVVVVQSLSHVRFFATLWTVARQAPLSMEFFRQEYWSGLPFPSPGDLPDPGIEQTSPALAGRFFTTEPLGKPCVQYKHKFTICSMLMITVNIYLGFPRCLTLD